MLWFTAIVAALAVGTLSSAAIHEANLGSSVDFIFQTFPNNIVGCYLDSPKVSNLEFKPEKRAGSKYVLMEDTLFSQCSVTINEIDESDNGLWRLHAESDSGTVIEVEHEIKVIGNDSDTPVEDSITTEQSEDATTTEHPPDITTQFPETFITTIKEPVIEILDPIAFETMIGDQINVNFTHTGFRETEICTVFTPDGKEYIVDKELELNGVEMVEDHKITCGLIITVAGEFEGDWMLKTKEYVFGSDVEERWLSFSIKIQDQAEISSSSSQLSLKLNEAVNMEVGPENAIYCKLFRFFDRKTLYEGHDRCQLVIDRVTEDYAGYWHLHYALEGKLRTNYDILHITVDSKPKVTTEVKDENNSVFLSCAVVTVFQPKLCRFTNPNGESVISAPGLTEDVYSFYGNGTNFDGEVYTHQCGLQISPLSDADFGMWSCTIDTDEETYYGYLRVGVKGPILTPDLKVIDTFENKAVTFSCHINAALRYCYFRNHRNGTTLSVYPGVSSDNFEYVGAGFDAGECAIKFSSLSPSDSGDWSCHVGFMNTEKQEKKADFQVQVKPLIDVSQIYDERSGKLEILGFVNQPLDYCRFVRIDGYGFSSDRVPSNYVSFSSLSDGVCGLIIHDPNILERHEWTVAAKITGQTGEVSDNTSHSLHFKQHHYVSGLIVTYYILLILGIFLAIFGLLMLKKEPRKWTVERANVIRNSFRKQPLQIIDEKPVANYV